VVLDHDYFEAVRKDLSLDDLIELGSLGVGWGYWAG